MSGGNHCHVTSGHDEWVSHCHVTSVGEWWSGRHVGRGELKTQLIISLRYWRPVPVPPNTGSQWHKEEERRPEGRVKSTSGKKRISYY
jgi:hypothetical protein